MKRWLKTEKKLNTAQSSTTSQQATPAGRTTIVCCEAATGMLRLPACLLLFICVIIAYNINFYYIKLYTHYFEAMFDFYLSLILFASSSSSYSLLFSHCVFVENFYEIVLNNVAIMLSKPVSKKNLHLLLPCYIQGAFSLV